MWVIARLRRRLQTNGIAALAPELVAKIHARVQSFSAFTTDNDPYGEHDFGAFEVEGVRVFFKLDYYDAKARYASPDPADPAVTTRVLTIMLAEEY